MNCTLSHFVCNCTQSLMEAQFTRRSCIQWNWNSEMLVFKKLKHYHSSLLKTANNCTVQVRDNRLTHKQKTPAFLAFM